MRKKRIDNDLAQGTALSSAPEEVESRSGISRRMFVKQSGTLILVSGAGCGEGINPAVTGTIRLLLTGLHASATSGGTATATPTAGGTPVTVTIPPTGEQSAVVPAGTYTVQYTPPLNHQLAPGSTVPSSVTIQSGQTTTVELALVAIGSLTVTVTGLTGSPANGGSASAQRTDAAGIPVTINISAAGTGSAVGLPTGTYSVTYTPPAGFTASGTNPVTGVAVAPGTPGNAAFTVSAVATSGSIQIAVTGLTGATAGGSVAARLTNNTGATFNATLSTPAGGASSGNIPSVPTGSYNVTYTAPAGFRATSGTTNPQVVAVTSGATANANFAAEVIPAGGSVIFMSNFATALGTTTAAKSDGNKWNLLGGFGQDVVLSTGLDFPSANVCKFVANRSNSGFCLNRHTGMPVPAVGSTRYYRWYVRMTFPDPLVGNGDHPWQDGNAVGDCNWLVGVHYGTDVGPARNGQWQIGVTFLINPNGAFDNGPWLQKGVTYRVECALERLTATTYDFQIKVFDSGNVQIFSDADFPADSGGGTVATRGPWTFRNPANLDGFNCGTNDFETAGNDFWTTTFDYGYQGCVAIVDDQGFIGPYGNVAGET